MVLRLAGSPDQLVANQPRMGTLRTAMSTATVDTVQGLRRGRQALGSWQLMLKLCRTLLLLRVNVPCTQGTVNFEKYSVQTPRLAQNVLGGDQASRNQYPNRRNATYRSYLNYPLLESQKQSLVG